MEPTLPTSTESQWMPIPQALDKYAVIDDLSASLLAQAVSELGLSARAYDKVRRVARTIADLEASEAIESQHVSEAVQYRLLDRML